ncbi:MAG: hypothetical protein U5K54_29530 [Cytophagales bacterium]|nr:hypothetical protein [Cytophagales bacterium]
METLNNTRKRLSTVSSRLEISRQIKSNYCHCFHIGQFINRLHFNAEIQRAVKALEEARAIAKRTNNRYAVLITSYDPGRCEYVRDFR